MLKEGSVCFSNSVDTEASQTEAELLALLYQVWRIKPWGTEHYTITPGFVCFMYLFFLQDSVVKFVTADALNRSDEFESLTSSVVGHCGKEDNIGITHE